MIVTVTSFKGGVGKTTTAVHMAAYLQTVAPTLLLDGDTTRNATAWSQRGTGFPFRIASVDQAAKLARDYAHIVIDLGQRPSDDDLKAAAEGCDLLVVPAVPSALDTDGLGQTIRALRKIEATAWRVLINKVSSDASQQATELRDLLADMDAPLFKGEIPRLKVYEKAAGQGVIVDQARERDDGKAKDRNASRAWEAYVAVGKELKI